MFNSAQRTAAALFVFLITAYFLANVIIQRHELYYGFLDIEPPKIQDGLKVYLSKVEDVINRSGYLRDEFVNAYANIQELFGKEENGDFDLVRAKDGSIHYGEFYPVIPEHLEEYTLRIKRLKEYAEDNGSNVIFLNILPLHTSGYTTYAPGLPHKDDNPAMDALLFNLQSYGVDYLDLREAIKNFDISPEKYRYKTDHHWTIETSFHAFAALIRTLEGKYGRPLDPDGVYTDPGNYSSIVYPDKLTGSLGHRAGKSFAGTENFTLMLPKFPTYFHVETDNGAGVNVGSGDFVEVLINEYYLTTYNMYLCYLNGLAAYKRIVNPINAYGAKVLLIHDSASLPLAAFMAPVFSEIEMIYPLSMNLVGYAVDIEKHIRKNAGKYDYIIIELFPDNFNETAVSFFK